MILDEIVAYKKGELVGFKAAKPLAEVEKEAAAAPPARDFAAAIRRAENQPVRLIAEVKKASPSKGLLCPDFDPHLLAATYAANGAAAISVLTDEKFFQGHLDYLAALALDPAVGVPLLRKDFIFDPYQLYAARAARADAALLIVAMLDDATLTAYIALAHKIGLTPLVEVHDEEETKRALAAGGTVIGINNRDLHTFKVDLGTTYRLRPLLPKGTVVIAESGIHSAADVTALAAHAVDAVLVGEGIVTARDRAAKVRELAGASGQ